MAAQGAQVDVDVAKLRADLEQLRNDIVKLGDTVKTVIADGRDAAYARVRAPPRKKSRSVRLPRFYRRSA